NDRLSDVTFHHPVGRLDLTPRKVRILQAGLPAGFELIDTDIYLFNRGEEIATNLSERRIDLTLEEVRQYLMLDHVANHRNETLPARPVWSIAPAGLWAAEDRATYDFNIAVDIDENGHL